MAEPHSKGLGSITPSAYIFQNPDKGFAERSLRNGLVTHLSDPHVRIPNARGMKNRLRIRCHCAWGVFRPTGQRLKAVRRLAQESERSRKGLTLAEA